MLPNVFQFTGLGFPVLRVQQNCWLSWLTHFQHQVVEKEFTAEAVTVKTSQGNVSILHSFIYSLGLNVKCCHGSEKDFVSSCPPPWFAYCSNSDVTPFTACHNLGPLQLPHLPFLRLSGRLLPACEMRTAPCVEHVYYLGLSSVGPALDPKLLDFLTLQAIYEVMEHWLETACSLTNRSFISLCMYFLDISKGW